MTYLDPQARDRLERLREHDSTGLYASDEPRDGTDQAGAITVTIDPTLRVTGVQIHKIELVRPPRSLADVFKEAYGAAVASGKPKPKTMPESSDRPRPVATAAPITARVSRDEALHRHRIRRELQLAPDRPRFGSGAAEGVSVNKCVTVAIPAARAVGTVTADPGWLQNASASNVANAIVEAFTEAYARRDQ